MGVVVGGMGVVVGGMGVVVARAVGLRADVFCLPKFENTTLINMFLR